MKSAEELNVVRIEDGVAAVQGFRANGVSCGIKQGGYKDIGLLFCDKPSIIAAAFTKNEVKAHPVLLDMERVSNKISAIIVNSGNANCLNGEQGKSDAQEMADLTEEKLVLEKGSVMVASTGVIGEHLNMQRIRYGIEKVARQIGMESNNHNFTQSIMTTDTRVKSVAYEFKIGGKKAHIGISAKGSGMIKPELSVLHATMLVFIDTDVRISKAMLDKALEEAISLSFNRINVDNDTSTNDSVFLLSNGLAKNKEITEENEDYRYFVDVLTFSAQEIAKMMVRDGEGANKLIRINVNGARSVAEAEKAARALSESYLVKTALFGNSPNWGRIAAALGYSGAHFNLEKLRIQFNDHVIYENSTLNNAALSKVVTEMIENEISITVDLGVGKKEFFMWTCDLSYDYIKINAHYLS